VDNFLTFGVGFELQEGKTVILIFSVHGGNSFQGIARVTNVLNQKPVKDYFTPGLTANFALEWLKKLVMLLCYSHVFESS
jgi:hypothetical protein